MATLHIPRHRARAESGSHVRITVDDIRKHYGYLPEYCNQPSLNGPAIVERRISIAAPHAMGCHEEIFDPSDAQVAEYEANPDGWAARYFGLSVEQYYEWVYWSGAPHCGATTKRGMPCKNIISGASSWRALPPDEFFALHRSELCGLHDRLKGCAS